MQTLKGNIRVFCRVRPLAPENPGVEVLEGGQPVLAFPPTGERSWALPHFVPCLDVC